MLLRFRQVFSISSPFRTMARRSHSTSPAPRPTKRAKIEHLTKEDFKNGVFLAPMVRSGALPTRLMALKHGATLVWGPEIVDKAILFGERVVDPETGVVSFNGKTRAIWATHPIEKPYLIYQIGSADVDLAVQAAKTVMNDVSGIELNCGCPKPFSTHSGMGAALLTNPDLLCNILTALREAMPPEITVTAKIRLLPSQEDTLKLVERIVNTGISALTVHCRTRNMREKDRAVIERLREIVEFVEKMGKGIAVVENGDCLGWEDAKRVRAVTGASSVMIARGAESNPSCFSETPLTDVEQTFIPSYLRLARYLDNHWSLTKFCVTQFKGAYKETKRQDGIAIKQRIASTKDYDALTELVGEWTGKEEFDAVVKAIEERSPRDHRMILTEADIASAQTSPPLSQEPVATPTGTQNPEPPTSGAPLFPNPARMVMPALATGEDPQTPTPAPSSQPDPLGAFA